MTFQRAVSAFRSAAMVLLVMLVHSQAYSQHGGRGLLTRAVNPSLAVTPYAGLYMPVGSLVLTDNIRLRPVTSVALGSRLALALTRRVALEGAFTWTPNLIAQSDSKETIDLEGGSVFSSVRTRVRIGGEAGDSEASATLVSGLGVVHRWGVAWTGLRGTTDIGLVIGGGLRYLERTSGISFTVDIEDFMTQADYTDFVGQHYGRRLQNDLVFSFGVAFQVRQ
jgi:hypothetical protein